MRTLYLRHVPDEVVRRLEQLAEREHLSLSALAVRELSEVSRRADNPVLLAGLPDLSLPADQLLAAVASGRSDR